MSSVSSESALPNLPTIRDLGLGEFDELEIFFSVGSFHYIHLDRFFRSPESPAPSLEFRSLSTLSSVRISRHSSIFMLLIRSVVLASRERFVIDRSNAYEKPSNRIIKPTSLESPLPLPRRRISCPKSTTTVIQYAGAPTSERPVV